MSSTFIWLMVLAAVIMLQGWVIFLQWRKLRLFYWRYETSHQEVSEQGYSPARQPEQW